jgi:hypothetical protein
MLGSRFVPILARDTSVAVHNGPSRSTNYVVGFVKRQTKVGGKFGRCGWTASSGYVPYL